MALLEALPEEVENSLRELRAQRGQISNGSYATSLSQQGNGSALPTPPVAIASGNIDTTSPVTDSAISHNDADRAPDAVHVEPMTFATDIDATGKWGTEWLVLDHDHLYVFAPNGNRRARVLYQVPLSDVKEAKAEMQIGNGLLEVRTAEETLRVLRFSQATVGEAHAVARRINALAKGEALPQEKVEEKKKFCARCKRVLPEDSEVCPACVNKRAVMLRLFQFLAPYKALAAGSIVLILLNTAAEVAPPWIAGRVVDSLETQTRTGKHDMMPLFILVGLLGLSRLLVSLLMYGQRRLNPWLGGRILMDIRVRLFDKFTMLSLGYYDKRSVGTVMSRITNDADNLWDFLTDGVPWLLSTLLTLVLTTAVLFKMNWQLSLLLLLPAPCIYGLNHWFMPRARGKWRHVWHRISRMYSALNSTLNGMRVVKAFAQEEREDNNFRERNRQVFEASYAANAMWAVYWPALGLLISLGAYIMWLVGGYQEAITRLVQNRTTFAIAHRLSTLRNASRLVVMKDGKMVECGTHDELMEMDGEYAKLVNIQMEVNKLHAL